MYHMRNKRKILELTVGFQNGLAVDLSRRKKHRSIVIDTLETNLSPAGEPVGGITDAP